MKAATARAHPNLALVKYWGKRDDALILPHQSSVSLTLAPLEVTTTVEFGVAADDVELNGQKAKGSALDRVLRVTRTLSPLPVRVKSSGSFPVAAGLASSAAGFAALAVASRAALGLAPDAREASLLARLGSGSACRSIQGGFCAWRRGERADGGDSFAQQLSPADAWPEVRMVVAVVSAHEKDVSSRDGMQHTVQTSPFYEAWVRSAEADVAEAERAIAKRDLAALGELAESNAWRMHATGLGARPPLCYLEPETLRIIQGVRAARKEGLRAWFTLDAGPNPVLLTEASQVSAVLGLLKGWNVSDAIVGTPGGDAVVL